MIPIPSILRIRVLRSPLTWLRRKRNHTGKVVLLPVAAAFMALNACNDGEAKQPPQIIVQDNEKTGEGLAIIGFAIVGAAVVVVLGRLLR
jgi:hypothetical protein